MIINSLNPWRRTARLVTTFAILVLASTFVARAQSQPPSPMFQNSTLTGSGNTINATRVPVAISSSLTVYVDITMKFDMDTNGNLTVSAGYPQIAPSPNLLVGSFKAGKYVGPTNIANGKAIFTVGGPGVPDGGASAWSLLASDNADKCTYPGSATWYVGPIENTPQAARLKKAGITSTAWSYGVSGVGPSSSCFNYSTGAWNWENGSLIGVSQSGNTLTIASFSRDTGGCGSCDQSSPVDQITYMLAP